MLNPYALSALLAGAMLLFVLHLCRTAVRKEREARLVAETAATEADYLARLASAFARARSSDEVLELALHEPIDGLRGYSAVLATVDAGAITLVRAAGYDTEPDGSAVEALLPRALMRECVRSRQPLLITTPEQASQLECLGDDAAPFRPIAILPVVIRRRLAAIVRVDFASPRELTPGDQDLLAYIGDHAALALERESDREADQNARAKAERLRAHADEELGRCQLIEHELRASETRYRALATRTTRLHALTAALSEAVTTEAVATAIVHQAAVVVGATAGDVLMLNETGTQLLTLQPERGSFEPDTAFEVGTGWYEAEAVRTRQPVFVASWADAQERFWRSASRAADGGYASSAALPLTIDGAVIGILRFDFSVPVNFDEEYQALLVSVAQHCTQALDRARLYESAQRARKDAEAASRLKDEFLSVVSHELRTPLNAVLGWSSMLQKTGIETALAQRAARSIQDNATRQAKLIDDLLDVSRIAAGSTVLDMQELPCCEIVGGVVESLAPVAAESGVELSFSCDDSAIVKGDRRRLEQVFFNIIGNALKFTPANGRVSVTARIADTAAEVVVEDTGIGIDPAFLPHVFDRFRQADATSTRAYGGLGLGLAIARQLVDAHGGRIAVASDGVNQGTRFHVSLPLVAAAPMRMTPGPATIVPEPDALEWPRLDGVNVLAVDDEPAARDIVAYALGECGANVTTAMSAPEAFELLQAGRFDVLLADVAMPGEDGCALMRRLRACGDGRLAALPAAAVTAHARDDERREVLQAGFQMHLVKPIHPRELARAIRELVATHPAPA
jgi:signal transduction histidine kinase